MLNVGSTIPCFGLNKIEKMHGEPEFLVMLSGWL